MEILFSLIGNRDPYSDPEGAEPGPVLSLLQQRTFDRVYLFYTGSAYLERARTVEEAGIALSKGTKFLLANVEFDSPADYEEVFGKLKSAALQIADTIRSVPHTLSVLLDPGTPQMQTAWFLLVRSGVLPAPLVYRGDERRCHRRRPRLYRRPFTGRARCPVRHLSPHPGGDRHRKRTHRPHHPRIKRTAESTIRASQLCRHQPCARGK